MDSKTLFSQMAGLTLIVLILSACTNATNETLVIDAPDKNSELLLEGAGEAYTYYALWATPPREWDEVSAGILWICTEDERPPLIPQDVATAMDGGGFLPGTVLQLVWKESPSIVASSELGFTEIYATVGITYEACIETALGFMNSTTTLLLTETDSTFTGKEDLVAVEFR